MRFKFFKIVVEVWIVEIEKKHLSHKKGYIQLNTGFVMSYNTYSSQVIYIGSKLSVLKKKLNHFCETDIKLWYIFDRHPRKFYPFIRITFINQDDIHSPEWYSPGWHPFTGIHSFTGMTSFHRDISFFGMTINQNPHPHGREGTSPRTPEISAGCPEKWWWFPGGETWKTWDCRRLWPRRSSSSSSCRASGRSWHTGPGGPADYPLGGLPPHGQRAWAPRCCGRRPASDGCVRGCLLLGDAVHCHPPPCQYLSL